MTTTNENNKPYCWDRAFFELTRRDARPDKFEELIKNMDCSRT